MVGGNVREVIIQDDKVWVDTVEDRYDEFSEHCAIYVERNAESEQIKVGDIVWWHAGTALWTKYENGIFVGPEDVRIPRLGFSGVSRPEV